MSKKPVFQSLYDFAAGTPAAPAFSGCTPESVGEALAYIFNTFWFQTMEANANAWPSRQDYVHTLLESPYGMACSTDVPCLKPVDGVVLPLGNREWRLEMADLVLKHLPEMEEHYHQLLTEQGNDGNTVAPPLRTAFLAWCQDAGEITAWGWTRLGAMGLKWLSAIPADTLEIRLQAALIESSAKKNGHPNDVFLRELFNEMVAYPAVAPGFEKIAVRLYMGLMRDIRRMLACTPELSLWDALSPTTPLRDEFVRHNRSIPKSLPFMTLDIGKTVAHWLCHGEPQEAELFLAKIVETGEGDVTRMLELLVHRIKLGMNDAGHARGAGHRTPEVELSQELMEGFRATFQFAVNRRAIDAPAEVQYTYEEL